MECVEKKEIVFIFLLSAIVSPGHAGENEDKRLIMQLPNSLGITVLCFFSLCCAGLLFVLYLIKKEERGKKELVPLAISSGMLGCLLKLILFNSVTYQTLMFLREMGEDYGTFYCCVHLKTCCHFE